MPRKQSSFAEVLVLSPWWVSAGLAGLGVVVIGIISAVAKSNPYLAALKPASPFLIGALLFISLVSAIRAWANGKMLDRQTGIDSIIDLSWKEFEDLMAEAFRQQGFGVEEMLGGGPDGGIDLVLRRGGEKILVQCKRWRNKPVPVSVVRETYGLLMVDRAANSAKVVTTSGFTPDAVTFARGKPIELIGKDALLKLLHGVQSRGVSAPGIALTASTSTTLSCPKCEAEMVRRTARKGASAGQDFWGCRNYPECRGTRPC